MKQPVIIGAVVLVGLLLPIVALQQVSPPSTTSGSAALPAPAVAPPAPGTPTTQSLTLEQLPPDIREQAQRALGIALQNSNIQVPNMQPSLAGSGAPGGPRYSTDFKGIGMAVMGVTPNIRACYQNFGKNNNLPPDVHVSMTIGTDPRDPSRGIVTEAKTFEQSFQHPTVENCLKEAVSALRFDAPPLPIKTSLPLVLAQR